MSSSDSAIAGLPGNYTFVAGDGGTHVFNNIALETEGNQTITATDSTNAAFAGRTAGSSVVPGAATQLAIITPPYSSVTAGHPLTDPILIGEEDAYGNLVTSDNTTRITASLASGGGVLDGQTLATVSQGIASFNDLEDDTAGSLTLQFAAPGFVPVVSQPSFINPGPIVSLVIKRPPSGVTTGIRFALVVNGNDAYGNVATSFNGLVTVTDGMGKLTGTTTMAAASGVAAFDDLVETDSGEITFSASSGGITSESSGEQPLIVSPGIATNFVVTTTLTSPDVAGTAGSVTVTASDSYGNPVDSGPNVYLGMIELSSLDSQVSGLPAFYTFVAGDKSSPYFHKCGFQDGREPDDHCH